MVRWLFSTNAKDVWQSPPTGGGASSIYRGAREGPMVLLSPPGVMSIRHGASTGPAPSGYYAQLF